MTKQFTKRELEILQIAKDNLELELEEAYTAYETAVEQIRDVGHHVVSQVLERHKVGLVSGNGTYHLFHLKDNKPFYLYEIKRRPELQLVYEILELEVVGETIGFGAGFDEIPRLEILQIAKDNKVKS